MKIIFVLMLASLSFSCQTVHEYCSIHAAEYGGYESCYSKEWARRQAMADAVKQSGDSFKQQRPVTCTTNSYGYGTYQTSCR